MSGAKFHNLYTRNRRENDLRSLIAVLQPFKTIKYRQPSKSFTSHYEVTVKRKLHDALFAFLDLKIAQTSARKKRTFRGCFVYETFSRPLKLPNQFVFRISCVIAYREALEKHSQIIINLNRV